MEYQKLRMLFKCLEKTLFHPQWLISRHGKKRFEHVAQYAKGFVLDIGCSGQQLKKYLPADCMYTGLDYFSTAKELYETTPTLYGNAENLPFRDQVIDTVALLEVLEHLPNPNRSINEIFRVVKPGGYLILTVPFFYPTHDAPYDFQRFTIYGLRNLAESSGFDILAEESYGNPLVTAAFLFNIGLAKVTLDGIKNKKITSLFLILLPFAIPGLNMLGWLSDKLCAKDSFMALTFTVILRRR